MTTRRDGLQLSEAPAVRLLPDARLTGADCSGAVGGVRDVAAQVVLGVDARCEADVGRYRPLADRVLVLSSGVIEQHLATLRDACTQPWMLRLDSDEVASRALIAALPDLVSDARYAQYWISRRWLTEGGRGWLDEAPWWPDHQIRLVRTEHATFSGVLHSSADAATPRGAILAPIYHADAVLKSLAERQHKVANYAVSGGDPSFRDAVARVYEPERFARRLSWGGSGRGPTGCQSVAARGRRFS